MERKDTSVAISQAHNNYLVKLASKNGTTKASVIKEMIEFCGRHQKFAV